MLLVISNIRVSGMRVLHIYLALFFGLVLNSGCKKAELAPVTTLHQGLFQVEILAAEGVLKQGPNDIQLQVKEDQKHVSIKGEHLVFTMPHTGGQSYMEKSVDFNEPLELGLRDGQVTFDMPGRWKGQLHIEVPDDLIALTFEVDVVESFQ